MRKRNAPAAPVPVEAHHVAAATRSALVTKLSPTVVTRTASSTSWPPSKRRGPGRPRIGKGAKRVLVTVERGLLEQTDAYAKRHHVTRSHLICDALRAIIASEQKHRPPTPSAA